MTPLLKTSKNVLVTGASGVVGYELSRYLMQKGYCVRVLLRPRPGLPVFDPSIECVFGDLNDPATLEKACQNIAIVFHLAAKLHEIKPDAHTERLIMATNVTGTRNLLTAAQRFKVERFIFFSTISVYGKSKPGTIFKETDPTAPMSVYARSKVKAERIVLANERSVVLRLAAVYGSGMTGNYPQLIKALKNGFFVMIGKGQNRRTLIHIQDVCRAALLVAERQGVEGCVYNVTDGRVHEFREIIGAICKGLGKPCRHIRVPINWVEGAAKVLDRIASRQKIGAMIEKLVEDLSVSGAKLIDELDFRPQYDLEQGWAQTLSGMKARRHG